MMLFNTSSSSSMASFSEVVTEMTELGVAIQVQARGIGGSGGFSG